jgi:hypothetical protein
MGQKPGYPHRSVEIRYPPEVARAYPGLIDDVLPGQTRVKSVTIKPQWMYWNAYAFFWACASKSLNRLRRRTRTVEGGF